MPTGAKNGNRRLACLSTYPPRQCGIATFTQDLCNAIAAEMPAPGGCEIVALNDTAKSYAYPSQVCFEIQQEDPDDYRTAAEFLNIRGSDLLLVQHEYGIYGGDDGKYLARLLRRSRMPVITTMHTILPSPSDGQRAVTEQILQYSDRVVVMAETAVEILKELYGIDPWKISVIPHGIPDLPFVDPNTQKERFGIDGRTVLLTFGLVSPGKGLEYVIEALPLLVERHPDLLYIVLGATHPKIKERDGDAYLHGLQRRADELGVLDHVKFRNRYVSLDELCDYLAAADIYVTPYLGEQQIVSGTLAYAMGAGKAIVSTPYLYAKEMLAGGRGRLVPFRDSAAIAREAGALLDDDSEREAVRLRAYQNSRPMVWKEVARSYLQLCDEVLREQRTGRLLQVGGNGESASFRKKLPDLKLDHLQTLCDDTGILQHACFTIPDRRHGYCTDDNARALMAALGIYRITKNPQMLQLANTSLGFLYSAFCSDTGRFRNFLSYDRRWLEEVGSEDSHGRALWALGVAINLAPTDSQRTAATQLFSRSVSAVGEFEYSRSRAFALLGISSYLKAFGGDRDVQHLGEHLANELFNLFREQNGDEQWPWPEQTLTYANARLPHALLLAGKWLEHDEMIDMALRSLAWLLDVQTTAEGCLSPIGNDGWYRRGGDKAHFDQQPIEAFGLVEACAAAGQMTAEPKWGIEARRCFDWFLGKNNLGEPLYDFQTGGCHDGLHAEGVNLNEGAESTLAWILSLLAIRSLDPTTARSREPLETASRG